MGVDTHPWVITVLLVPIYVPLIYSRVILQNAISEYVTIAKTSWF
jgi:hypothetical protein